jgi:hypothetical protein
MGGIARQPEQRMCRRVVLPVDGQTEYQRIATRIFLRTISADFAFI